MTSTSALARARTDQLWGLLVVGLAIQVASFVVAFEAVPRTEIHVEGAEDKGDRTVMLLGILGFGLGGVLSLTAVVAFGVMLGIRASRAADQP
jgi:hypothetical protein